MSVPSDVNASGDLVILRDELRRFSAEREWDQYHSPKNLAIALSVEASELLEHFQWLTEEQSRLLPSEELAAVGKEMADVLLYLISLADKLNVDLIKATKSKLFENAHKYPAEKARGNSKKYTSL